MLKIVDVKLPKEVFGEKLESTQGNKIIGFTYGDTFSEIEEDLMG